MEESELIDRINALDEAPMLLECSKRAKRRFGLRGGLLRNLILSEQVKKSLFDYIDPFSDLDCVVERQEDWSGLSSSLASSIAYAGFYRWEVQTLQRIAAKFKNYPTLPSERLIAWFDGRSEKARISLESLDENLHSNLSAEQLPPAFQTGELDRPFWDRILVLLRRMRALHQFAGDPDILSVLAVFNTADVPEYPPTSLTVDRLQILLASLAMTSINLSLAIKALKVLDAMTRHAITQQGGQIAYMLLAEPMNKSSQITTSIYSDKTGRHIDLRMADANFKNARFKSLKPLIPWTLFQSPYDPGCCEYSDFGFGVGVVASRGTDPVSLVQIEAAEIVALPIEGSMEDAYQIAQNPLQAMEPLPLPGILTQSAQSIVLRVDHAFPSTYLGRPITFFTSALVSENAQ
ncbi:MAG TPA: hypothetical protein VKZ53_19445 [Candidatus Angelobacter sp.]|nr:hypothetical protein [Candidatus Angelobacter sp.]